MSACPPSRGHWLTSSQNDVPETRFLHRTLQATPLFMADAFPPALLLYHPPRGLRDNGLQPSCKARAVSRVGTCDMLSVAEAFVRNATIPPPPRVFSRCAVVGSGSHLDASDLGGCIDAHDAVIRLNDAPVAPQYMKDVGTRTTWRLSTMQSWVDAVKVLPTSSHSPTHGPLPHFCLIHSTALPRSDVCLLSKPMRSSCTVWSRGWASASITPCPAGLAAEERV